MHCSQQQTEVPIPWSIYFNGKKKYNKQITMLGDDSVKKTKMVIEDDVGRNHCFSFFLIRWSWKSSLKR